MGVMAEKPLKIDEDSLESYLRSNTRVFIKVKGGVYYVTHTDGYWRIQDCSKLNEKGHFTDCSELCSTLNELLHLHCINGMTLQELAEFAEFRESVDE